MPIRVICTECGSKLDIREELAGSTRRCPKCKTEFVVPVAAEVASESAAAAETPAPAADPFEETPATTLPAVHAAAAEASEEDDPDEDDSPASFLAAPEAEADADEAEEESEDESDDDDEEEDTDEDDDLDYLPDFVTGPENADPSDQKSAKKSSPNKNRAADDDDDDDDSGPVLAIPKLPPPPAKKKSFDPAFLESDIAEELSRKPAGTRESNRGPRKSLSDEMDDFAGGKPEKPRGGSDFKLPAPNRTGVGNSDADVDSRNVTKDRAQAARELRQALKDSALNPATVQQKPARGGIDFVEMIQEFGLKGLALLLGIVVLAPALYYASDYAMGKARRPALGQVTGTLTMDGMPVPKARIYFYPMVDTSKQKEMKRTSIGMTDEQGKFQMFYEEKIGGVAVGKCRVWMELPYPLKVPPDYTLASTTTIDVVKGKQTIDFPLKSQSKK